MGSAGENCLSKFIEMSTYSEDKISGLNIRGSGSVYEASEEAEGMVNISRELVLNV